MASAAIVTEYRDRHSTVTANKRREKAQVRYKHAKVAPKQRARRICFCVFVAPFLFTYENKPKILVYQERHAVQVERQ